MLNTDVDSFFKTPAELCTSVNVLWELLDFIRISQTEQGALFPLSTMLPKERMSNRHLFLQTS